MRQSPWTTLVGWLVTLALPLMLLLTSIRLLLTPVFVDLEYSMPSFPEDSYGMTFTERRQNAKVALESILDKEGISLLERQRFADGSPMYNERELGHMQDVRNLTQIVLKVWWGLLGFLLLILVAAWRFRWWEKTRTWLLRGAQLTIGVILLILLLSALNFDAIFTDFHRIFFKGDTWLFYYSDTLIRLFPMRFWQDVFISLGLLTLLWAGLIWWGISKKRMKEKG